MAHRAANPRPALLRPALRGWPAPVGSTELCLDLEVEGGIASNAPADNPGRCPGLCWALNAVRGD